jgi:hypothetical protein
MDLLTQNLTGKRVASILAALVLTLVIAIGLASRGETPAGATGPGDDSDAKLSSTPGPPAPLFWSKKDIADERKLPGETVEECPLDAVGCSAVESILTDLAAGDGATVSSRLESAIQGELVVGSKPGLQLVGEPAIREALDDARFGLSTVAIGCPQENALGAEPGACADIFVLAIDISGSLGRSAALALLFAKSGTDFELLRAEIEPQLDIEYGGGASGFPLPLDLTNGRSVLWYTTWKR